MPELASMPAVVPDATGARPDPDRWRPGRPAAAAPAGARPSGSAPRATSAPTARRSAVRLRWSSVSSARPKSRRPRRRTSTTTSERGGSRVHGQEVQLVASEPQVPGEDLASPAASSRPATSASPSSPIRWAAVDRARSMRKHRNDLGLIGRLVPPGRHARPQQARATCASRRDQASRPIARRSTAWAVRRRSAPGSPRLGGRTRRRRTADSWSPASRTWSACQLRRWCGVQAVGPDRVAVLLRRVALVALPAVLRVADGEAVHHPVADGLGDHRRAGDRVDQRVAVHDRRVRAHLPLEVGDAQPVDEHVVVAAEARDRPAHREVGGVVDVAAGRCRRPTPRPRRPPRPAAG